MFQLETVCYIAIFDQSRLRDFYHAPEFPTGFTDYRQAWGYIYSHDLPANASPVEVYL